MTQLSLPLGIDIHVHFRQPGFDYKETVKTGYQAALAGGIGTVADMPNTNPPIDNKEHFKLKQDILKEFPFIHQIGAVTNKNVKNGELLNLVEEVKLLKVFMANSTGDMGINHDILLDGFNQISQYSPTVMIHAEQPDLIQKRSLQSNENIVRPPEAEINAIETVLDWVNEYSKIQFHVTHVTTTRGAELLINNDRISFDVLAKHLSFSEAKVEEVGNLARMNPPLRGANDQEGLLHLLAENKIPIISSDHAPHTKMDKQKLVAGAPGVQELYSTLIDFYLKDIISKSTLENVIYHHPKNFLDSVNMQSLSGTIIVDTDQTTIFDHNSIRSKCGWSLWEDLELQGKIIEIKPDL